MDKVKQAPCATSAPVLTSVADKDVAVTIAQCYANVDASTFFAWIDHVPHGVFDQVNKVSGGQRRQRVSSSTSIE